MGNISTRSAFKVAVIYFAFSSIWIFGSDYVLSLFIPDISSYHYAQTIKGMFFIILSSLIIYYLIKRELEYNKKATQDISLLRRFDHLTNLYNRESFHKELEILGEKGEKASIIMSDINGLKIINEVYSSEQGDHVLAGFSRILEQVVPPTAFISRIGGDEFCCILYNLSEDEVKAYANAIVNRVKKKSIDGFPITVSIGYSTPKGRDVSIQDILREAEDRMIQNKLLISESASNAVLSSLKTTLFERSDETELHADRIAKLCEKVGHELKLPMSTINELKLLGFLHDIGKIGVDDAILKKPRKLTESEYQRMKKHCEIGFNMANAITPLEGISYYILTHHEHWDGNGYPKGLKGEEIPLLSRIVSIADAFDAMTNDRCYRKALSNSDAIKELKDYSGTQFDPTLVPIFLKVIKEE